MKKRILNTLLALGVITEMITVAGFQNSRVDSKAAEAELPDFEQTEAENEMLQINKEKTVEVLMPAGLGVSGQELPLGTEKHMAGGITCFLQSLAMPEDIVIPTTEEAEEESEYANLAVAKVDNYVNVRDGAGTDSEVVGKMYDGSVAEILDRVETEDGLWFHVASGNVDGYIKAEYFVYGAKLLDSIEQYIQKYAVVQVTRLNVRTAPSVDAERISYVDAGDKLLMAEKLDDWVKVYYSGDKTGYVAAEYVKLQEEYVSAKSLEEEQAELAARQEQEERERKEREEKERREQATALAQAGINADGETGADLGASQPSAEDVAGSTVEDTTLAVAAPSGSYSTNPELRGAIVDYAMQYVGNRYVHGGQSLTDGTDCSGFTCYVYRDFGYSISRTPSGQYSSAGRSISLEEAQPGDIICYGSKSCSHVGLYIGNGQIVHEANSKKGCIVSDVNYMNILGVRNVID